MHQPQRWQTRVKIFFTPSVSKKRHHVDRLYRIVFLRPRSRNGPQVELTPQPGVVMASAVAAGVGADKKGVKINFITIINFSFMCCIFYLGRFFVGLLFGLVACSWKQPPDFLMSFWSSAEKFPKCGWWRKFDKGRHTIGSLTRVDGNVAMGKHWFLLTFYWVFDIFSMFVFCAWKWPWRWNFGAWWMLSRMGFWNWTMTHN